MMKQLPPSVIDVEHEDLVPWSVYDRLHKQNTFNRRMKKLFAAAACFGLVASGMGIHMDWVDLRVAVAERFLALDQLKAQENDAAHRSTSPCGHDRFECESLDWTILKAIAKNRSPFDGRE